jgi:hypothetical protein
VIGVAGHFVPELHGATKQGPLYIHDKDDLRGTAPLTPQGFAELAMKQPEFAHCMADRFAAQVMGVDVTEADIEAVQSLFRSNKVTVKALAKAALLRYAQRPAAVASAKLAPEPRAPNQNRVGQALHARLGKLCGDCHHDGADLPNLESFEPPRELVLRSLDMVASEFMPKSQAIPLKDRLELIRMLIAQLWQDEKQRADAYETIAGQLEQPHVYRWPTLHHAIDQTAGVPLTPAWGALENAIHGEQSSLTPNIGVMSTVEAIRACKQAGNKDAALEACVARATDRLLR